MIFANSVKRAKYQIMASAGLALICLSPQNTFAAETTAKLQGALVNAESGTKLIIRNTANDDKTRSKINKDGSFIILGLSPGEYEITFQGPDRRILRQNVILFVGETTIINDDMARATHEIVVVGRRHDVRTSEVFTGISSRQIDTLPQNGRNFLNFAAIAPGVSISYDDQNRQFRAGALNADAVNLFIDGISQKNQIIKGGISGQDSSRGNPFPQNAIQEYKVATQNFKAEYEQAASAIISAVTKSGGNEFIADAFVNYQSGDMIGHFDKNLIKNQSDYSNIEYGLSISGPIARDKLFYFLTYEARKDKRPSNKVIMPNSTQLMGNEELARALANQYNGEFAKDFEQNTYFGKLSLLLDENNSFNLTYRNREESDLRDFGNITAFSAGSKMHQFIHEASGQWKYKNGDLMVESAIDYQSFHFTQNSLHSGANIKLLRNPNDFGAIAAQIGGYDFGQDKGQESLIFKSSLTYSGWDFFGSHIVKTGLKFADFELIAREGNAANNPNLYFDAATYILGGENIPVGALLFLGDPKIKTRNFQAGIFVQDDWKLNNNLILNLGIRWDWESNMLNNKYLTPFEIANAMRNYSNLENSGIEIENYIATTPRKTFKGAIQPRFGFAYDVFGDRNLVFFGGAGRYYDRTMFDMAQIEIRRQNIARVQLRFPQQAVWNPIYSLDNSKLIDLAQSLNLNGEIFALSNDVKIPYSDQFNLGIRKKFGQINSSIILSHAKSNNLFNYLLASRLPDGQWGNDNGAYGGEYDTAPWAYGINGYGNMFISSNDRKAKSTAIYLTIDRPYSKNDGFGYSAKLDLNNAKMLGVEDWILAIAASSNDLGWHNAEGVDKWRFVANGIFDGPFETMVSATATLASGGAFRGFTAKGVNNSPADRLIPGAFFPKKAIGFSIVDIKISKDFTRKNGQTISVDGQIFNLFNTRNKIYSERLSGASTPQNPIAPRNGDYQTIGPARSFQIGLKYSF